MGDQGEGEEELEDDRQRGEAQNTEPKKSIMDMGLIKRHKYMQYTTLTYSLDL